MLSAVSFFGFGVSCYVTTYMRYEFNRYGLGNRRLLVGFFQVLGAIGLLVGFVVPAIGLLASGCLSLLMLLGVGVRIKIKDTFLQTTPALFYCLLNAWICITGYPEI